jgi:hypothetical protein
MRPTLIPEQLIPELMERHRAGQSDSALVRWLAGLDPPVVVTRVTVLNARTKAMPKEPTRKASGAANRARAREREAQETADEAARGGATIFEYDANFDAGSGHHKVLKLVDQVLGAVAGDKIMTLPEKIRHVRDLAATYSRLKVDAEIQAEQDEIRKMRKIEQAKMDSLRADLEREQRRLAAERRELEEQRRALAGPN